MRYFLVLIVFINTFTISFAQDEKSEVAKAVLLFYVSNLIEWPNTDSLESFNIGVLSTETVFAEELKKLAQSYTVHNKPIVIKIVDEFEDPGDIHVMFVDKQYHKDIDELMLYCQEYHILQVTDRLENKRYTVINFVKDSETDDVGYEVNKANLVATNLNYQDELLLYGGSLKDLRELYSTTKELLDSEAEKVVELSEIIVEKTDELESKNVAIDSLTTTIDIKKDTLNDLLLTINKQTQSLYAKQATYNSTKQELSEVQNQYQDQLASIEEKERKVLALDSAIKVREGVIETQSDTIELKDLIIEAKTRTVILLMFLGGALFVIGLLIYRAYFVKKKNNRVLSSTLNKLKVAQNQLVDSEKMAAIGTMAAGVAHEINTPLNYIKGGVYGIKTILEKEIEGNEQVNQLMEGVDLGVDRAANIVSSLNHFSRQSDVADEKCDIKTIVDNCLVILHHALKHRIKVEQNFPSESVVCYGNEGKIHQVLLNIITNATQAIDDEGNIWITSGENKEAGEIFIEVRDSGCGIKPENLEKVTAPFFTTKEAGKGTGLGLSITKKIISDHGGALEIESELNKGTSIRIKLPISQVRN